MNRIRRNVVVAGRNDLALGVVEMLRRVLNSHWLSVGVFEGVPDHIEPITVRELCCFIPLIRRKPDRLTTASPFDLDATNTGDWVAVPRLRISRAEAAHVKTNLQVPHTFALKPPTRFVGDDYVLSGYFGPAPHFGIEIIKRRTDLFFNGARARQY